MATASIVTPVFRLSFPNVFKPKAIKGSDKEKFGITMLFLDNTPYLPKDAEGNLICPKGMKPEVFEQTEVRLRQRPDPAHPDTPAAQGRL
jgi:hypothetical protein